MGRVRNHMELMMISILGIGGRSSTSCKDERSRLRQRPTSFRSGLNEFEGLTRVKRAITYRAIDTLIRRKLHKLRNLSYHNCVYVYPYYARYVHLIDSHL